MKPVKNAADEGQVKRAELDSKFFRDQEIADMNHLLKLAQGRRFMWRFLSKCNVFSGGFNPNQEHTYFREGERNIGLALLDDINQADSAALVAMMNEAKGDSDSE